MSAPLYAPAKADAGFSAPQSEPDPFSDYSVTAPEGILKNDIYTTTASNLPGIGSGNIVDVNSTSTVQLGNELYHVTIVHPDIVGIEARQEFVSYSMQGEPCADITVFFAEGRSTAGAVKVDQAPLVFVGTVSAGLTQDRSNG